MNFKIRCHTIGVHLKLSNYPQQPLFGGGRPNISKSRKSTLDYQKTCDTVCLKTPSRSKVKMTGGGGSFGVVALNWDFGKVF